MRSLKAKGKKKRTKNECQKSAHNKTKQKRHKRETLKSMRWYKNQNIVLKPKRKVERPKDLDREIPSSDKNNTNDINIFYLFFFIVFWYFPG